MAYRKKYKQIGTRKAKAPKGGWQEVPIWREYLIDTGKYKKREPRKR